MSPWTATLTNEAAESLETRFMYQKIETDTHVTSAERSSITSHRKISMFISNDKAADL